MSEANDVMPMRIADQLKANGFRPTRLARQRTDYTPAMKPAPARPGFIVAALDDTGLAQVRPGLVEALNPEIARRIKLMAESVRLAGVPVMVVLVDRTPSE